MGLPAVCRTGCLRCPAASPPFQTPTVGTWVFCWCRLARAGGSVTNCQSLGDEFVGMRKGLVIHPTGTGQLQLSPVGGVRVITPAASPQADPGGAVAVKLG